MKLILELVEKYVSISGNTIIDTILFAFIGLVSFSIAFGLVGFLFDAIGKYNRRMMSDVHWALRIVVFMTLTYIFVKIFQFFAWILSLDWWIYVIGGITVIIFGTCYIIKHLRKTNKIKKIKNGIKCVFYILKNNACEILTSIIIVVAMLINLGCRDKINELTTKSISFEEGSINFIIVLFPFVLTVLSIALSLPKDLIYGIEKTEFRKLKGASKYSFLKMLVIAMILFVVYFLGDVFDLSLMIFAVAIVSVIYCFLFLWQEIPLLMHNDKRIEKIIKHNVWSGDRGENLNSVLHNLLFTKGISKTYNLLKVSNSKELNRQYLDMLLDLHNHFLWRVRENFSSNNNQIILEYKNLKIIDVIDKTFENIQTLLNFNDDINMIDIYEGREFTHQITRLMFSIKEVLVTLEMNKKYEQMFRDLSQMIFIKTSFNNIDDEKVKVNYKIINSMMISTLSSDEIWFLEIIRDNIFLSSVGINIEYMVFASIYLYYIANLEPSVSNDFRNKINELIKKQSNQTSIYGNSWECVFRNQLNYLSLEKASKLLVDLLKIYDTNQHQLFRYNRPGNGVYTSTISQSFTRDLLMNWWIGYILTNENIWIHSLDSNETITIPNLSEDDLDRLAKILQEKWFKDGKVNEDADLEIFKYYNQNDIMCKHTDNIILLKKLSEFLKIRIYDRIIREINANQKTDQDLIEYKQILSQGLIDAIENHPLLDKEIDLTEVDPVYFSLSIDTVHTKELVKMYVSEFSRMLSRLIYDKFNKDENINKNKIIIKNYTISDLESIISFNPDYKLAYIPNFNSDEKKKELLKAINAVPNANNLWLPRDLFFKNGAITVNFEYLDNDSVVRYLTPDEVNKIIDRDYRLVNGFYRYLEYSNSESGILLTRDEIYNLLSKKYMYASLVFKYKINIHYDKILYYKIMKD
ncbi:MAG: hypothetical protein PHT83_04605 [Bacilli bacterium]|nr:hypothetical protein [Bacilli bacterium]